MEITENGLLYLFLCPSQGLKQKLKKKKKKVHVLPLSHTQGSPNYADTA